jgi:endonuclease/exonuclease/phosphatase family metal-dependent hydrolase
MRRIVRQLDRWGEDQPIIVAGDFNTPRRHPLFRPLEERLTNAFSEAGVGWPHTFEKRVPALWLDHIWVSESFEVLHAETRAAQHTNHLMVIADLRWKTPARVLPPEYDNLPAGENVPRPTPAAPEAGRGDGN